MDLISESPVNNQTRKTDMAMIPPWCKILTISYINRGYNLRLSKADGVSLNLRSRAATGFFRFIDFEKSLKY